jgi:hypothetical protein
MLENQTTLQASVKADKMEVGMTPATAQTKALAKVNEASNHIEYIANLHYILCPNLISMRINLVPKSTILVFL